jgi:hypothetical protein
MSTSIPLPVSGEVITSAWGTSVRSEISAHDDRLDALELHETVGGVVFVRAAATGPFDSSGAAFIDWVSMGSVTVPGWARRVAVTVSVNGSYTSTSTTGIVCLVQIALGPVAGQPSGRFDYPGAQLRVNTSWTDVLTLTTSGVQALRTQISRLSGTGASGRADSGTVTTTLLQFLAH